MRPWNNDGDEHQNLALINNDLNWPKNLTVIEYLSRLANQYRYNNSLLLRGQTICFHIYFKSL